MQIKLLEILDRATSFVVLCVDMNPTPGYDLNVEVVNKALRGYGYPCDGQPNIAITHLNGGGPLCNNCYDWGDRTYKTAHHYIQRCWEILKTGDVVDVEFILGETTCKKEPERLNLDTPT